MQRTFNPLNRARYPGGPPISNESNLRLMIAEVPIASPLPHAPLWFIDAHEKERQPILRDAKSRCRPRTSWLRRFNSAFASPFPTLALNIRTPTAPVAQRRGNGFKPRSVSVQT